MITKKQKEVLDFVTQYSRDKGYAPSLEEIRKHFGLASVSTAHHYIEKLRMGEYLRTIPNQPRSMILSPTTENSYSSSRSPEFSQVPIFGAANAGPATLLAEENIQGYLRVATDLLGQSKKIFALKVQGDSMNEARIKGKSLEEGDFVLVNPEMRNPEQGEYVLSIIDDYANLKKFSRDKKTGEIMLLSESSNCWSS